MRNYYEGSIDFKILLKLRKLFVVILLFRFPSEQLKLWNTFKVDFCQEIIHIAQQRDQDFYAYNDGLIQMEKNLIIFNDENLRDFGLPSPIRSQSAIDALLCSTYDVNELSLFINSKIVDSKVGGRSKNSV